VKLVVPVPPVPRRGIARATILGVHVSRPGDEHADSSQKMSAGARLCEQVPGRSLRAGVPAD
jgi:hypothetical protein